MRLERWTLHAYALPLTRAVRWSHHVEAEATYVLLELTSREGHAGVAETTVKPPWNGVSVRSLTAALEDVVLPRLLDVDLASADAVLEALGSIPENRAARALVDNACWDLRAAAAGKPLWQIWNGAPRVALSYTVTRQAPQLMAREAAEQVARFGFRTLKVKGGQGLAVDVAAVRAVRAAVGEDVRCYVDANWAYRADETLDYVAALADAGAFLVEDPCSLQPDAAFSQLAARATLPLLVDEPCASLASAQLFFERGARAVSTKPTRIGLTECRRVRAAAHARGAITVAGLYGESALGSLAALQLEATHGADDLPAELTHHLQLREQILEEPLDIRAGEIQHPSCAGLSELVDWRRLERFRLR